MDIRPQAFASEKSAYSHPGVDGLQSLKEPESIPFIPHILSTSGWV